MKHILKVLALIALMSGALALPAFGQGIIAPGHVIGNGTSAQHVPTDSPIGNVVSQGICNSDGNSIVRAAGIWGCLPFGSGVLTALQNQINQVNGFVTSPVSLANGGLGAALSPSNGGLLYSTASQVSIIPAPSSIPEIPLLQQNGSPVFRHISNLSDTIIPLVHGSIGAGDQACFDDTSGTLYDCGATPGGITPIEDFVAGPAFTPGTTTTLTLNQTPISKDAVSIWFDGIYQDPSTWSLAGAVITFNVAIPASTNVVETQTLPAANINQSFVATTNFTPGVTRSLTLGTAPSVGFQLAVYFDGQIQDAYTWSVSGTAITFSNAIPAATQTVSIVQTATAQGVQDLYAGTDFTPGTTFQITLSRIPSSAGALSIWFDGTRQNANTWTSSGATVTFNAIVPLHVQVIEARFLSSTESPVLEVDTGPGLTGGPIGPTSSRGTISASLATTSVLGSTPALSGSASDVYLGSGAFGSVPVATTSKAGGAPPLSGVSSDAYLGNGTFGNPNGTVTPQQFGALANSNGTHGNGHDDTVALQDAVNASANSTLYMPCGIYRVTGTISYSGSGSLDIEGTGACTQIYFDNASASTLFDFEPAVFCSNPGNCLKISNIMLPAPYVINTSNLLLAAKNEPNLLLQNISASSWGIILGLYGADYGPRIIGGVFHNTQNTVLNCGGGGDASCNHLQFKDTRVFDSLGSIASVGFSATQCGTQNVDFSDDDFEGNANGINFQGVCSISIKNDYFESNGNYPFYFGTGGNASATLQGNWIYSGTGAVSAATSGLNGLALIGNTSYNYSVTAGATAVSCLANTATGTGSFSVCP